MIKKLSDQIPSPATFHKKEYGPLIEMAKRINRLVDIMNGSNNCEPVNGPSHPYMDELLEILEWFTAWSRRATDKQHFITTESFQDMQWLILGIVSSSCSLLGPHCRHAGHRMALAKINQDVCEHHFTNARATNTHPDARQVQSSVTTSTTMRLGAGGKVRKIGKGNCAGGPFSISVLGGVVMKLDPKQLELDAKYPQF